MDTRVKPAYDGVYAVHTMCRTAFLFHEGRAEFHLGRFVVPIKY
jgi:hypothetical protein